jgi:SAM-dependent methyltransferase
MTPEMIERAQVNAKKVNLSNIEFRQGYLENLPLDSNTVDVIISNCVINLSPDKEKVFNEAFRVLAPGGKLAVSDIVTDGELPESIRKSLSAWAGCVAGAVDAKDYIAMMESVGFTDISIKPVFFDKEIIDTAIAGMENEIDLNSFTREEVYKAVYSAKITAFKPA